MSNKEKVLKQDIAEQMVKLKEEGDTNVTIGDAFGVSEATVRRRLKKYYKENPKGASVLPDVSESEGGVMAGPGPEELLQDIFPDAKEPKSDFDLAMDTLNDYIGWKYYTPTDPPVCAIKDDYERILVLNDLHVPYHDETKFHWVLENMKGQVDMCVVAGDLSDLYSYSRYPKRHQRFTAVQEMVSTAAAIVGMAEAFPKVILMSGNHDERLRKHLVSRGIQGDELEAILYLNENFCNPMAALVQKHGLKNVELVPVIKDDYAEWNWIWQHGDLVLGHPEKFSRIPNKVVGEFISYLVRFRNRLKLNEFRVVGAGHTHQAGMTWNDYGVVGFEMGCLCDTPEYASDPKMPGARPSVKGYTMFLQDRATGRTNINLSRFYELSD